MFPSVAAKGDWVMEANVSAFSVGDVSFAEPPVASRCESSCVIAREVLKGTRSGNKSGDHIAVREKRPIA